MPGSVQQVQVSYQSTTYSPPIAAPPTGPTINLQLPVQASPASDTGGTPINTRPMQQQPFESLIIPSQPPPPPVMPQHQPSVPQSVVARKPPVPAQFTPVNAMSPREPAARLEDWSAKSQWTAGSFDDPEEIALLTSIHSHIDEVNREKREPANEKQTESYEQRELKKQQHQSMTQQQQLAAASNLQSEYSSTQQMLKPPAATMTTTTTGQLPVYPSPPARSVQSVSSISTHGLPVQRTQSAPSHHPPAPPPMAKPLYRGELYKVVSGLSSPIPRPVTAAGEYTPDRPINERQRSRPHDISAPPQALLNIPNPPQATGSRSQTSMAGGVSPSSPEETLPVIRPPRTAVSKPTQTATKPHPPPPANPPAPAPIERLRQQQALPLTKIPDVTKPSLPPASTHVNDTLALLSALNVLRGPLNHRENEAISRIMSLDFDSENLCKALVLEKIVRQHQVPQLKKAYNVYKSAPFVKPEASAQSTTTTTLSQPVSKAKPIVNLAATSILTTKPTAPQHLQQSSKIEPHPALDDHLTFLPSTAIPKPQPNLTLASADLWVLETMREYARATGRPHHIPIIDRFANSAISPFSASMPALMIKNRFWHEQDLQEFKAFGKLKVRQMEQPKGNVAAGDSGTKSATSSQPAPTLSNQNVLPSSSSSTRNAPSANIPKQSAEEKTLTVNKANSQRIATDPKTTSHRPRRVNRQKLAFALPETGSQLLAIINSWPRDKIARNILIAAGRVIPGEEGRPRYNQHLEPLKEKFKQLKYAELNTIDWDVIDPPRGKGDMRDSQMLGGTVERPIGISDLDGTPATSGVGSSSLSGSGFRAFTEIDDERSVDSRDLSTVKGLKNAVHDDNSIGKPPLGPISSTTSLIKSTQPPFAGTISSSQLGKNMFVRNVPGNAGRHTSTTISNAPVPLPSTPTKPVTQSPTGPPSTKKLTPQVVIISPRKSRVTPPAAIVRNDHMDVTPTKPVLAKRPAPSSSTASPVARRTPKRARTGSPTIDLTNSNDDEPILLNADDSSDDESRKEFTPSPSKRKTEKAASALTSFACRWEGCSADLHSCDTLEQHVLKVHGKPTKTKVFQCLWDGCPNSTKGPREYHDREEWEYHVNRMHLQPLKHACLIQGDPPLVFTVESHWKGCGQRFVSKEGLDEHALSVHSLGGTHGTRASSDVQGITPIIQPIPAELARKQRAAYDGPSRSFGIGQKRRK